MKIYRTHYHDDDSGSGIVNRWCGSKTEANAYVKEKAAAGIECSEPELMEFSTKKKALLHWLNIYAGVG